MIPCVIYCRVSGAGQLDGSGLDRQLAACEAFAATHGYEAVQVFREEGVSGTKESAKRPAYMRMLEYLEHCPGCQTILVEHLDRLARFYRVQETMLDDIISRGLTLYTANTGENVTEAIAESPMRKFLVQIQGLIAELDRSQIVAKLNKGRIAKKKAGGKAEGRYPFGRDPQLPGEAAALENILSLRRAHLTAEMIADKLNALSISSRSGVPWSRVTVSKILRRELP